MSTVRLLSLSSSFSSHIYFFACECGKYFKCFAERIFASCGMKKIHTSSSLHIHRLGDIWIYSRWRLTNEKPSRRKRKKIRTKFCFILLFHVQCSAGIPNISGNKRLCAMRCLLFIKPESSHKPGNPWMMYNVPLFS